MILKLFHNTFCRFCHCKTTFTGFFQAGYSVKKDALAYEASDSEAAKTYVNIIAVKEGNEDSDAIKALVKVLKSDDIKKFIDEKYDGAVIAFE